MTEMEYEAEVARLHAFTMLVATRLAAASEVLSILAERKDKRTVEAPAQRTSERDEE